MGHQASYYLTPSDRIALEARLRERFEFVILPWRSKSATPHLLNSLYLEEDGKPMFSFYVARPEDLNSVVTRYIPEQKYWIVETDPSPALEMDGSGLKNNILHVGRVYYVDGYYSPDDDWVTKRMKSEEFRKWAKKFLTTVKKSLKKLDGGRYAGEEAVALLESGKAVRARG